jgi:hypothetical protein
VSKTKSMTTTGAEGLKNLLTPRRATSKKSANAGSYNFKVRQFNICCHLFFRGKFEFRVIFFQTPLGGVNSSSSVSKPTLLHSFKRQNSEQTPQQFRKNKKLFGGLDQKLLSPQSSPAILVSPSAIDSIAKKVAFPYNTDETRG